MEIYYPDMMIAVSRDAEGIHVDINIETCPDPIQCLNTIAIGLTSIYNGNDYLKRWGSDDFVKRFSALLKIFMDNSELGFLRSPFK